MTKDTDSTENIYVSKFGIPNFSEFTVKELKQYMCLIADEIVSENAIKAKLKDNINAAPDLADGDVKKELEKAAVVMFIINKILRPHASEVVKGAHVIVEDDGALYDELKKLNLVRDRHSSHHRNKKYKDNNGIEASDASLQGGEIFREFLIGKNNDGKTWFQVEGHSLGGWANFIGHMIDYLKYKFTGQNVGQYGLSHHVDSNPINVLRSHLDEIKSSVNNLTLNADTPIVRSQNSSAEKTIR